MSKHKKLTLLWILASLLGVAMSAVVAFLLFGMLDITRFTASRQFLQLIWRLALCAVIQGMIVGGWQAAILSQASIKLAMRWVKNIVVGMMLGLIAPILMSLLTSTEGSLDSSLISGWLFSWVLGGLLSGSAIAPKRSRGAWGFLNSGAFSLYALAVLATFVFFGAALDSVPNTAAFGWIVGLFIFTPFVTVASLINSIIMRRLVRSAMQR
ncbi:hypothetical protein [Synechococcus sp. PCC 7335]|uniref:hypothetical protein n=1 Tax=Synechococcus sp. (strain ATCC 29403 / PCC 7335) TaxID=91464 RepID=UPI0002D6F567|nr:hypothetical protein [Synechococcus sp. PCC 7335]